MNHLTSDPFCRKANNILSQGRAEFSTIIGRVSNLEVGKGNSRDPHSSWMGLNKAEFHSPRGGRQCWARVQCDSSGKAGLPAL